MRSKRIRVSTTTETADRISSLPDEVICHILSFIPTEDSVRTRVLSTRWKYLFSFVPILNFSKLYTWTPDRHIDFQNFVDWVFNSYNVDNMDKFRLISWGIHPNVSRLSSWLSKCIHRGVRKLEIGAHLAVPFTTQTLPYGIFTCKTLTNLILKGDLQLDVPKDACLPHLRTLRLVGLYITDCASAQDLFRGCPLLKELFLERCRMGEDIRVYDIYNISIPSLRSLTIAHGPRRKSKLVLDCPNLEYLMYSGGVMGHEDYTSQALELLLTAHISYDGFRKEEYVALEKLLKAVCHVRHLRFSVSTWKAFQIWGLLFPVFFSLTHLELINIPCSDLILDILERAPYLQVLVVDNVGVSPINYYGPGQFHILLERVPACVSLHLKNVEFKGFTNSKNEFKMVEYVLKNAKILDMVKIQFKRPSSPKRQIKIIYKLLSFSKCSRACEIVLLSEMGDT